MELFAPVEMTELLSLSDSTKPRKTAALASSAEFMRLRWEPGVWEREPVWA
jgi:hypothetical protein